MVHTDVHDVTVALGANENAARVSLGKRLEHIREVHLNEYAIRNPNGGAVNPSRWRIYFHGDFYDESTTNGRGKGYTFIVDNATLTHVIYTRPRVISRANKGIASYLQFEIKDENGVDVTFDEATFYLSFVCEIPTTSLQQIERDHEMDVRRAGLAYTSDIYGA
jgi:hypothetical protein